MDIDLLLLNIDFATKKNIRIYLVQILESILIQIMTSKALLIMTRKQQGRSMTTITRQSVINSKYVVAFIQSHCQIASSNQICNFIFSKI